MLRNLFGKLSFLIIATFWLFSSARAQTLAVSGVGTQTCLNPCTGTITATATGGIMPYQYRLGTSSFQNSPVFTGLCPGVYALEVLDSTNTSVVTSVIVPTAPAVTFAATSTNSYPASACNGSIQITVTGAPPPYIFTISSTLAPAYTDTFTTNPAVLNNLCPGTYSITAATSSGCSYVSSNATSNPYVLVITILGANPLSLSLSSIQVCLTNSNMIVYASASGGFPPYQYSYSTAANPSTGPWSSSPQYYLYGLVPTTVFVCVKDSFGVMVCANIVATPLYMPPIPPTSVISPSTCNECNAVVCINNWVNGCAGSLDVYYFDGNYVGNNPTVSNVCPGWHSIIRTAIYSSISCPISYNIFVPTINQIQATVAIQAVGCASACNGSLTLTPNITAPVEYSIDSGNTWQNSNIFSSLCSGSYQILIRKISQHGCSGSITATVPTNIPSLSVLSSTAVTCLTQNNGSVTLTTNLGNTVQFSIDSGLTWQSSPTFTGLAAGNYTAMAMLAGNLCPATTSFTIGMNPAVTFMVATTPGNCAPPCGGMLSVYSLNPSGSYQFSFDGGNTWINNSSVSNVCAGTYTVSVRPQNATCAFTQTATISPPTAFPVITAYVTPATCNVGGSVQLSVSPSASNYTYSINNGPYTSSSNFSNLSPGTYIFHARNNTTLCVGSQTVTILPPASSPTISIIQAACNNSCNATITINPQGNSTYQFQLNNSFWQNSPTFTNLCPGTYTFSVWNNQTSSICTQTFTITGLPGFTSTVTPSPATCSSLCDGVVNVNTNQANSYTYSLDNQPYQNLSSFTGLCPGSHQIQVMSADGCVNTHNLTIGTSYSVQPQVLTQSPSCFNNCNGNITVASVSPVGNYTYALNNNQAQSQNTFNQLCAGNYTVTIQDSAGCSTVQNLVLTNPPVFDIQTTATPNLCSNSCNGVISVTPSQPGSIQYQLNSLPAQSAPSFNGLCAGQYVINAVNLSGCVATDSVTINVLPDFQVSTISTPPVCFNDCNGQLVINATPAGNYSYSIDAGLTYQPGNVFGGLCSGTYQVQVMDANGCVYDTNQIITSPAQHNFITQVTDPLCAQSCTGSAQLSLQGAAQYSLNNVTQPWGGFYNLCAGTYLASATDSSGCVSSDSITITSPSLLQLQIATQSATCGACNGAVSYTASGGTPAYSYSFTGSNGPVGNTNLCPGTYTVQVTDSNDCFIVQTVVVDSIAYLQIDSVAVISDTDSSGTGQISVFAPGAVSYQWQPAVSVTAYAVGLQPGIYCITASDSLGCIDSVCVTLGNIISGMEEVALQDIRVIPNPFSNELMVSGVNAGSYYRLTDTAGRIITEGSLSVDKRINIPAQLAAGHYIFTVYEHNRPVNIPLVKVQ
ncbi:MAG: hypothetical protein MUC87_19535 [Bacteroidia bacterium]|jgi:hypothetical protein|nr:hypothetical protein [Bacteroidia bacterium]